MTVANSSMPTYSSNLKGSTENRMVLFRFSGRFTLSPTVSFRTSGSTWLSGVALSARIGVCELGRPLLGLTSCPLSRDRTRRRTRPHMAFHPMFWGDGLTCLNPTPQIVADVSPPGVDRGTTGALKLRPSGARQRPVRRGRRPTAQPRPSQRKRRHYEHEARGTEAHQRRDPPPFGAEQRNHPRRHHLPDGVMFRGGRDARFRSGYLGPVGDAGGAVTPRNSGKHKH